VESSRGWNFRGLYGKSCIKTLKIVIFFLPNEGTRNKTPTILMVILLLEEYVPQRNVILLRFHCNETLSAGGRSLHSRG
jgi:hypothetical protein